MPFSNDRVHLFEAPSWTTAAMSTNASTKNRKLKTSQVVAVQQHSRALYGALSAVAASLIADTGGDNGVLTGRLAVADTDDVVVEQQRDCL